ncbi:MAG: ABC transporter permease [Bacteroidota bacterium]
MIKNFLKIAIRNMLRNRLSSFINVFGLTLGISACVVILIFVEYESSFDSFHKNANNTFRVVQHTKLPNETLYWNTTAYPLAAAMRNDFPEIDMVTQISGPVTRVFEVKDSFESNNLFEEPKVLFVDPFYPKVFDVEWVAGNKEEALNETASVVLTENLAQKYFNLNEGSYHKALGRIIALQTKDPLKVTGVIKAPKGNGDHQYNMLIPYEFFKINNPYFSSNWSGNYQGTTYVVLNEAANKSALESKISGWKKKYLKPLDDKRISYHLQPLEEIHTETKYGSSPGGYIMPKNMLNMAKIIALFVLLIALVNFVNLVTAQSHTRTKEVGVRKVMGSNRPNLILQSIFENGLLIFIASIISIALVQGLIQLLNRNLTLMELKLAFLPQYFVYILIIAVIAIVLACLYPAVVFSASNPVNALRGRVQVRKNKTIDIRKGLVTAQFVIVQLFVIGAIILAFQMEHFKNSDLGFDKETALITEIPNAEKGVLFREKLLSNSEIAKVAMGSGPPMAVNGFQLGTTFRLPQQAPEESLEAEMKIGDIHYLDFFGLELVAGRNFHSNKDTFDEFIVNETLLKAYGWTPQNALGKRIQINEGEATIVGVVKDFHNNALQNEISPCIFLNWSYYQSNAFIKWSGSRLSGVDKIQTYWEELFTKSVYKQQFLDDAIEKEYLVENLVLKGFSSFSILSILIGCLGLFGLMSFIVSRKSREISIRKVLGASLFENIVLFSKEFIKIVGLSFFIASPFVYYFMSQWLEGFTYRIQPSIWMFLSGGLITLFIALLTCSFQSVRAALVNPAKHLRSE